MERKKNNKYLSYINRLGVPLIKNNPNDVSPPLILPNMTYTILNDPGGKLRAFFKFNFLVYILVAFSADPNSMANSARITSD